MKNETIVSPHVAHLASLVPAGATVYTKYLHVSKSGMTSEVMLLIPVNGEIVNISYYLADCIGHKIGVNGGVIVKGFGLDLAHWLVMEISKVTGNKNLTKRSI